MRRWIYADRYVGGDIRELETTLLEHSAEVLEAATAEPRSEMSLDGSFVMDLGARVAGMELSKQVRVRIGPPYRSDEKA